MLEAFYDYLLAINTHQDGMVFVIDVPFTSVESFSKEVVEYVYRQVRAWNDSQKPDDIIFEYVDWHPDYEVIEDRNFAALAVRNFNLLTSKMVYDNEVKCCYVFNIAGTCDFKECRKWFEDALELPFTSQMVWGIADIKGSEKFHGLENRHGKEVITIAPPIDMDAAAEKLAEQAYNEDKSDPVAAKFRLALIRLMNSVKSKDTDKTELYAKECLNFCVANVAKDINWLSQVVTVYTVLFTDKLARKEYDEALYFCDKAVEAASLGIGKLDPSLAYRLLGTSLIGKGGILMREKKWHEASDVFAQAEEAYRTCKDYLMQSESLRLCGWCLERQGDDKRAAECYIQGFRLADILSADLIRNSAYPLLLLRLLESSYRTSQVSDKDMDSVLTPILGKDWKEYLYSYRKNMCKLYGMDQQDV